MKRAPRTYPLYSNYLQTCEDGSLSCIDLDYDEHPEEKGEFIGVYLKANYTAEHEGGIERIQQNFGIARSIEQYGVEHRTATGQVFDPNNGGNLIFIKRRSGKHTRALLVSRDGFYLSRHHETFFGGRKMSVKKAAESLGIYALEDQMSSVWDRSGFAIYAPDAKLATDLEALYQAFLERDVLLMLSGPWISFFRGGINISIISRLPEQIKQDIYLDDKDAHDLQLAAEATGIRQLVDQSDKKYFALSPAWCREEEFNRCITDDGGVISDPDNPIKTQHPVKFWLNPVRQEINASGWFTVEELEAWARDEALDGPIANRGTAYARAIRIKKIINGDLNRLYRDEVLCVACEKLSTPRNGGYWHGKRVEVCNHCYGSNLIRPEPIKV